jgi:hypothetical protein
VVYGRVIHADKKKSKVRLISELFSRAAKNPGILPHATQINCVLLSRAPKFLEFASKRLKATRIDSILFSRATKTL